jgi:hypothetical protein
VARAGLDFAAARQERKRMGSPADYTIIVLLVAVGVGVWTLLDRLTQLQRDVDAIKRKLGAKSPADPNES